VLGAGHTSLAIGAAATYFFARAAHFALYTAGVPVLRTLAFVIGFGAEAALLLAVMGVGRGRGRRSSWGRAAMPAAPFAWR
jgi:hypothetical protein